MLTKHVTDRLAAFIDGELPPEKVRRTELHLKGCSECRAEYEQIKLGMEIPENLTLVAAPEAIWTSIESALRESQLRITRKALPWRPALAASLVLAAGGTGYWHFAVPPYSGWEEVRINQSSAKIRAGRWIETDATSHATITVGSIGWVEVTPNTRLRIVTAQPGEHRLALAQGEIRAKISAPPRLFFVDTASGTAVDLGCEYALKCDANGFGLLSVTRGWVSFERNGVTALVPAGASCRIRPHVGPGLPWFDDASGTFIAALDSPELDSARVDTILATSRPRDTLTLWHLLSRVDEAGRARVYDRIAALTRVPDGISRSEALQLEPKTLNRLKEELAWTW